MLKLLRDAGDALPQMPPQINRKRRNSPSSGAGWINPGTDPPQLAGLKP